MLYPRAKTIRLLTRNNILDRPITNGRTTVAGMMVTADRGRRDTRERKTMSENTGRTKSQDEDAIDPDGDPELRNPRDERDADREDVVDEVVNPYNT